MIMRASSGICVPEMPSGTLTQRAEALVVVENEGQNLFRRP